MEVPNVPKPPEVMSHPISHQDRALSTGSRRHAEIFRSSGGRNINCSGFRGELDPEFHETETSNRSGHAERSSASSVRFHEEVIAMSSGCQEEDSGEEADVSTEDEAISETQKHDCLNGGLERVAHETGQATNHARKISSPRFVPEDAWGEKETHASKRKVDSSFNLKDRTSAGSSSTECSLLTSERHVWQKMLSWAVKCDILTGERLRYTPAVSTKRSPLKPSHEDPSHRYILWVSIRAALHGNTPDEELRNLQLLRQQYVDAVLSEVLSFEAPSTGSTVNSERRFALTYEAVRRLLEKVDMIESLYPSLRALARETPAYTTRAMHRQLDSLYAWMGLAKRIRQKMLSLRAWVGIELRNERKRCMAGTTDQDTAHCSIQVCTAKRLK
ncbi:hypothetical protein BJ742DRAFT_124733 [Cladochytrium replicatum]|nr:hypothetical protein BJ742DRAFT_124733 [Cladochytrium replicatum]